MARQVNTLADAAWLALMNETRGCARNAYATGLFCYSPKRYTRARPQRGSQTMGLAELVLLAIGLSMDAFAVSICKGLGMKRINLKVAVILGLFFGGFQAGMPVIGWALGSQFMGIIGPIDHWIAFILLAFIGGKMLWEAFTEDEDEGDGKDAEKIELGEYLILAIATSIDALAVGHLVRRAFGRHRSRCIAYRRHNVYLLRCRRSDRPHLWRALRKTRHHRGWRRAHPHRA